MGTTNFELPAIGLTTAFRPCSECYEIFERELHQAPGSRAECSNCRNVLLARIVNKTADQIVDRFRPFDGSQHDVLADVMFDGSRFNVETAKAWLGANNLTEFADKGRDERVNKFMRFSRDEKAQVDMYVRLDKGVIGRCAVKEVKFTFSGSGV